MKTQTNLLAAFSVLTTVLLLGVGPNARAAETVINFDDVAAGTLVNTYYAGVTFTNPIGGNIAARSGLGFAPSSPNVVCVTNGGTPPFFDSPFGAVDARFATPVRVVKIDARPVSQVADHLDPTVARPYLQAFDASGNLLATVYYAGALPQGCCNEVGATETLTFASSTANIARARFSSQQPVSGVHTYGLFDNLRFDDGYYTLSTSISGNGSVAASPSQASYFFGTVVTLTATPAVDWAFASWLSLPDGNFGHSNPLQVTMNDNKNINFYFNSLDQVGPSFVVNTKDDHDDGIAGTNDCTLREAINHSQFYANPTITFATNVTGVITLTLGELTINRSMTIVGPGAKVLAVNVNNSSSIAHITGGAVAAVSGLSLNNLVVGFNAYAGLTVDGGCALWLTACQVSGFRSQGIFNGGTLTLNSCTVSGNTGDSGGGIRNFGTAAITNSTLSGNGATTGGGIWNQGTLTLIGSTVCSNNTPSASGTPAGGIRNTVGTVTVGNSLIAANTSTAAAGPDCVGSFTSLGYNLIGKTNDSSGFGVSQDQAGSIASPLNPRLGPLADNGGLTLTHTPLTGSSAIDKGKSFGPITDQRGRIRPFDFPGVASASGGDSSDIGAVEVNPPVLNIVKSLNNVVISWPTNQIGFTLQSAAQLAPPLAWTTVPLDPVIVGSEYKVTTNTASAQQFYRLFGMGVATIPGLFNTGVGANGVILASGSVDPHWQLIQSADSSFPGPNTIVVNDSGFPIPPWLANGPASKWIAPQADQSNGNLGGDYKYRISFDLTGLEPSTAVVTGHWTSDNLGPDVRLNGATTGLTGDGNFPTLGNAFTISTGFIAGLNTLDFVVNNGGTSANPTGVRVELSGTANFQPPP